MTTNIIDAQIAEQTDPQEKARLELILNQQLQSESRIAALQSIGPFLENIRALAANPASGITSKMTAAAEQMYAKIRDDVPTNGAV